ncbi:MAG: patatin-like phospholipase family protein [Myxococcota bacterium]
MNLTIRAGARATERLRAEGFHPELFGTLVGASGGPKWLALRHLDAVLVDRLILPRRTPIDTIGSSIGSFRHACFAQSDPHAALARFAEGYVQQSYVGQPTMEAISEESDRILAHFLGESGASEIEANPLVRNHIVAAQLHRDRDRDRGPLFQAQLGAAAFLNAFSRKLLGRSFKRLVFGPTPSEVQWDDMQTLRHPLTRENVQHALLASGSIPLLMKGVRGTPGVPGTLFDGGIVDYHFDFSFKRREGLVLFPHFFDRITPGWFDKPFSWRKPKASDLEDVVMVAPSNEFVAALPGGKVPDRNDFLGLETDARIAQWLDVIERCRVLGDEFNELIETKRLQEVLVPF